MLEYDKMLFTIPAESHTESEVRSMLKQHKEVKFVSLVGFDIGGHDTDEKIPVDLFMRHMGKYLRSGVQTDGSSVVLPRIADLNNARVDIVPDLSVNWYVDYNLSYVEKETGLPVGTLRIPSFLVHNDTEIIGSRTILKDAIAFFKKEILKLIRKNSYVWESIGIKSAEDIAEIMITCATELEFWVKTPDDKADREQLSTAQILKEQYWKRTIGPVRTSLERSLTILDKYGLEVEMGHKEVGGIKAKMGSSGNYDHVMEQLEIDWKYSSPLQAADNENQVKYVIKDVFRHHGLDVTFMAKPIEGIAGSGEHTHMSLSAKLRDGRVINLFSPRDIRKGYLSPIGFGALMGLLKNYEVINPFINSSTDALNRAQPGYEAPVCIVTSIGIGEDQPSRNRTVLVGLVRDLADSFATRFELRSPNPKSNTYLVIATSYMAMLDGIREALENEKSSKELLASLSKKYGEEDFYLERDREYCSEENVFEAYTEEERGRLFGNAPRTVWENLAAFDKYPDKLKIFSQGGVMDKLTLESFKDATLSQWAMELYSRIIPNTMDFVRECRKLHTDGECTDFDIENWEKIQRLRRYLGQDTIVDKSLLTRIKTALDENNYALASQLQIEMYEKVNELSDIYFLSYKKNLL
ncbi:MAG: glutamine synthetase [Clostridiales bacterium]|nr:glutamine synthetase [Clostridiales bacterium]